MRTQGYCHCWLLAYNVCCQVFICVARVTAVLGYQPQDLLGKSAFEFYHPEDKSHMKDTFEQGNVCSRPHRFNLQ